MTMETIKRDDLIYAIDQLLKLLSDDDLWNVLDNTAKIIAIHHIPVDGKDLDRKA